MFPHTVCLLICRLHAKIVVVNALTYDDCVLLPCLNAQPDISAVMNCCVVALSVFSSDILTFGADIFVYIQCQGRTQGGCVLNTSLELDILQKLYHLHKRTLIVFAYFLLVDLST